MKVKFDSNWQRVSLDSSHQELTYSTSLKGEVREHLDMQLYQKGALIRRRGRLFQEIRCHYPGKVTR